MSRLPAPVALVVRTALATAVRRCPAYLRDELAREWAAELHAIAYDPASSAAERSWRSLGFACSLACSRGIDTEPTTRGYVMRSLWKPLTVLVAAPIVLALLVSAAGAALIDAIVYSGLTGPGSDYTDTDIALIMNLALVFSVALGAAGRWCARLAPLPVRQPVLRSVAAVWLMAFGLVLGVLVVLTLFDWMERHALLQFGLYGAPVWGLAMTVVAIGIAALLTRSQRLAAAALAALGGFGSLLVAIWTARLGLLDALSYPLSGSVNMALFPHIAAGVTVFALTYVYGHRPARTPEPVAEPEAVA